VDIINFEENLNMLFGLMDLETGEKDFYIARLLRSAHKEYTMSFHLHGSEAIIHDFSSVDVIIGVKREDSHCKFIGVVLVWKTALRNGFIFYNNEVNFLWDYGTIFVKDPRIGEGLKIWSQE